MVLIRDGVAVGITDGDGGDNGLGVVIGVFVFAWNLEGHAWWVLLGGVHVDVALEICMEPSVRVDLGGELVEGETRGVKLVCVSL